MSSRLLNAAVAFLAITSAPAVVGGYELGRPPHARALPSAAGAQGQYAAPAGIGARAALPACGFAAVESWGPNGFQYCDPRNVHGDGRSRDR